MPVTSQSSAPLRRARVVPGGPLLVEGPLEVSLPSGEVVRSNRFMVAICMCHRSAVYPLCDASHKSPRGRRRAGGTAGEDRKSSETS
ncbi:CDGSH iron-sulfur domain-containing protein [Tomitella fengzijianii]|uniref:CDGSH iron-sulfur domain-containing protein n=2 Tax=Tomitella fengzijianii TaxID=2597660 RepID=A0A516X831_9ACTN|nr:CDGSH iron-sulfur domain-containing protein [Tomitella fengzijianii]QDQ99183.1 CDGSH iron-sulfur domain-containing protein [Tomitella fengzijianii]